MHKADVHTIPQHGATARIVAEVAVGAEAVQGLGKVVRLFVVAHNEQIRHLGGDGLDLVHPVIADLAALIIHVVSCDTRQVANDTSRQHSLTPKWLPRHNMAQTCR